MSHSLVSDLMRAADLPDGLAWAVATAGGPDQTLWPGEAAALRRPTAARRAEFAAGRSAARDALAGLGADRVAIPAGTGRAPRWPDGIIGSISHAGGLAVALVGRARDWLGLGIDLERRPDDVDTVREAVLGPQDAGADPMAAFGAKEAAFKAQFPATGVWIDFRAAAFEAGPAVRLLDTHETAKLPPVWRQARIPIVQRSRDDWLLSIAALARGDPWERAACDASEDRIR